MSNYKWSVTKEIQKSISNPLWTFDCQVNVIIRPKNGIGLKSPKISNFH